MSDPEYMTIIGAYNYSPTTTTRDGSNSMLKIEIVSKADKNEITSYDDFAFTLFKESDVSNLMSKLSDLFNQVKEKSGYGDNAYIGLWKIERNGEGFVSTLIDYNSDVNITDNAQHIALYYAAESGFTEIVEIRIMAGAEGN